MTLLFLLAVLLAIPSSGLSIVAWVVWFFLSARKNVKEKGTGLDHMRATRATIEPLVGGTWSDFYQALDIPKNSKKSSFEANDTRCGQHILNFISHNPHITQAFMNALKLHRVKGNPSPTTAIDSIRFERDWQGGPVHYICYLAISTLTSQNNMPCFDDVDMVAVRRKMLQIAQRFPEMLKYT